MNEQDIPIDIHVNKLQDWLVSRRIVDKNWHRHVKDVRNSINEALKDMPANEQLVKLLSGDHINYFHCQQIIEILKMTEKDSKNIFGSYSSQRMKDWIAVLKLYEKDNLYMAEAGQIFSRNISYEIPNVRKQITQFEKLSDEALKKSQDAVKSENILRNEYNVACQQLGIKGDKIKVELTERLKDLPELQSQVVKKIVDLKKAVSLYENFSANKYCLPLVKHIMKSGNTTVYEYKYSDAPISVQEPPLPFKLDDDDNEIQMSHEIDFGDNQAIDFGDNEGTIDFGDDLSTAAGVNLEVGEIDWGGGGGDDVNDENNQEIDFNISLEESGIVVEEAGMSGGVAKDEEAFTILDSPHYRDVVLDELYELESFLKMRLYELATNDKVHVISMSLLDGFTDHDTKTVTGMLAMVDLAITSLTTSLIQQLYQIKHSPKYVDILTNKLRHKLRAVDKLQNMQKVLKEKSIELTKNSVELRPTLEKLIEQTKTLQKHIEKDISKRYKNRVVNLMGANL
ncbi:CLUMA_CG001244, isoform A [Clunio marinus]|uniref:CLUMA_CG001244, isoform A n=1 Tax=Clunio marinus TaxID=568069 RepID=A0A1J1HHS6_9DIPT|nr:CLUMA_CG001244, isoform A [Clunio marinus]